MVCEKNNVILMKTVYNKNRTNVCAEIYIKLIPIIKYRVYFPS